MPDIVTRYSYATVPTIKAFSECDAFIRALMGPFRSGKSSGSLAEIIKRANKMPRCQDGRKKYRQIVVRNTYGELRDTTIKTVHQWLPPISYGHYKQSEHVYEIRAIPECDIEIMFRALDRPDHVSHLLSLEVTNAWVNEAREVPWAIIEALQGRVGQYPPVRECGPYWHGLWLDTNPPDQDSEFYKFFEETNHPATFARLFKQPSGLSPIAENWQNLVAGRNYYTNLAQGKSTEYVKVYIKGEYGFVVDGKAVFGEDYNDTLHCTEEALPVSGVTIYRGWDFGLTPACIFAQMRPDGRFAVFDELTTTRMGIERFSDEVLEYCAGAFPSGAEFEDVGDPAGSAMSQTDERSCFEIMQGKGIDISGGMQGVDLRLECVRKPLNTMRRGKPQFMLNPQCRMLRKGFLGGYQYRRMQTKAARFVDKPDKSNYSHPHDALQYICTRLFSAGLMTPLMSRFDDPELEEMRNNPTRNPVTGY